MVVRSYNILESEAKQLLRGVGYKCRILQKKNDRQGMPFGLVAFRTSGETRYIRIRKVTRRPATMKDVAARCDREIALYQRWLSRLQPDPVLHCEIWIFAVRTGFHCYEVLQDSIREIPTPGP